MERLTLAVGDLFGAVTVPNVRLAANIPTFSDIYNISKDVPVGIYVVLALIAAAIIAAVVFLRRSK